MNILINASKEKMGGGVQVSDSICRSLNQYPQHNFTVIVSDRLQSTYRIIKHYANVTAYIHTFCDSYYTFLTGRYRFLDDLVKQNKIDAVLTVFGPCRWTPKVLHVCGFAMAHLIMEESPYYKRMTCKDKIKSWMFNKPREWMFRRSSRIYYSENDLISKRVEKKFGGKCYTVTNYYHQIYDHPEKWEKFDLPEYNGITLLDISAYYPHKNMEISIDIAKILIHDYPELKFRFIFTIDRNNFPKLPGELEKHFLFVGRVKITQCPSLYKQSDIVFQPSLLECFTATFPEAMRMGIPIVTTNLDFARALCGNAALYYEATNAESAAKKIWELSNDKDLQKTLISNGIDELAKFDNYDNRARKLIRILENEYKKIS